MNFGNNRVFNNTSSVNFKTENVNGFLNRSSARSIEEVRMTREKFKYSMNNKVDNNLSNNGVKNDFNFENKNVNHIDAVRNIRNIRRDI